MTVNHGAVTFDLVLRTIHPELFERLSAYRHENLGWAKGKTADFARQYTIWNLSHNHHARLEADEGPMVPVLERAQLGDK